MSPFRKIITHYMGIGHFREFGTPEFTAALSALAKASEAAGVMISGGIAYEKRMKALGFPIQLGSTTQAPYDTIADFFRGTKGSMLDMFCHPDKLLAATEKIYPVMLKLGLSAAKREIKRVFVPLSIMCTGTPDDVRSSCKALIERVGKDGGYIMDCSTVVDDAKPENLKAMIDFVNEYGRY